MTALLTDLRAAIKALASSPAFFAIAVATLATGLALATALLAVVNAYVVRALPYPEAHRIYRVDYAPPNERWPEGMAQLPWSSLDDVIEHSIAWDLDVFYLLGRDYPESAPGAWVTPGYLRALGIRAALGRSLRDDDFKAASPAVALISHRLWQGRFHGDPNVIGSTFNAYVSDRPEEPEAFTIVGVLPADLWHVNVYTEVLAPLKAPSFPYQVRVRSGIRPEAVRDRIDALVTGGVPVLPPHYTVSLTSISDSYVAQIRPVLWSVAAGSGLVLLIAIANVTVLMLVRARARERELAVRLALGASPTRVSRFVALEGLIVGSVSTILGVMTAGTALPFIAPAIERSLDRRIPGGLSALAVDWSVLQVALLGGVVLSVVLMVVPAVMLWRSKLELSAAASARGTTAGIGASRLRAVLIGIEIAASLTLVVGASLVLESAIRMTRVDFGIDADEVVTAGLAVRQRSFPDESARAALYERLERELEGLAGSSAVAFGDWWPLQGSRPRRVETADAAPATANPFAVSSRYFEVMGIRLLDGRVFTVRDRFGSEPVAVVSATLAARLWPHTRAVGQSLTIHPDGDGPILSATVIGIVSDTRQSHTDTDQLDVYLPLSQRASRFAFLYLRRPQAPSWEGDVRSAIARVNPEVAIGTPRRLGDGIDQERSRGRALAFLLTIFAVFASVLALVGMHGVIAYTVRQRQREIAVRIALGADSRSVMRMFLRHGAGVLVVGLLAGTGGAMGLGRVLQSQLYGVEAGDPRVLAAALAAFGMSAMAAVLWPARRAASVDPVEVLKTE